MVHRAALTLALAGCAGGPATDRSDAPLAPPVVLPHLPAAPGVALRIAVRPAVWDLGAEVEVAIELINDASQTVVIVPPQDGSWWGQRDPDYSLEFLDDRGAVLPRAIGQPGGCGNVGGFHVDRLLSVPPGGRASLHDAPHAFPYPFRVDITAHPGRHRVRLRYRADLPGASPIELVSNTVDVTIRGSDQAVWSCYNHHDHIPPPYTTRSHAPRQAIAFADGWLVLDRPDVTHAADYRWRRTHAWSLLRLDRDGRVLGRPLALRGAVGWGDVQLLAVGPADVRLVAAAGPALHAMTISDAADGPRLGPPVVWSSGLSDADPFALTADAVLYFGRSIGDVHDANDGTEAVLQRIVGGAPLGDPVVVGVTRSARVLSLAADPRGGWWTAWSGFKSATVQHVDPTGTPDAAPIALADDEVLGLHADPAGFTRVLQPDARCLVRQSHTAAAEPGPAVAIGDAIGSDCWAGQVAWNAAGAAVTFHDVLPPPDYGQALRFAGPGGPTRTLSRTAVTVPARLAARGDEWLIVWSDHRADNDRGCLTSEGCVGELWIAIATDTGLRVPPTAISRDAAPAPPERDHRAWRDRCDALRDAVPPTPLGEVLDLE
jgi:hypothetical protein